MGKFCEICEKGTLNGNNVSHSNRKTHRTWAPNVQCPRGGQRFCEAYERLHPLPAQRQCDACAPQDPRGSVIVRKGGSVTSQVEFASISSVCCATGGGFFAWGKSSLGQKAMMFAAL